SCGSNGFKCPLKSICVRAYTASGSCICQFGKLPGEPLQPDPATKNQKMPQSITNVDAVLQCQQNG
ncbi:Hypothetical predicted protein, partial [Paramuricea clavata]